MSNSPFAGKIVDGQLSNIVSLTEIYSKKFENPTYKWHKLAVQILEGRQNLDQLSLRDPIGGGEKMQKFAALIEDPSIEYTQKVAIAAWMLSEMVWHETTT